MEGGDLVRNGVELEMAGLIQSHGFSLKQKFYRLVGGISRPFIRLANIWLRRRKVCVRIQHPNKTAHYPLGDPHLHTPLDTVVGKLDELTETKIRWAQTSADERARLARLCATRACEVADRLVALEVEYKGAYETSDADPYIAWYVVPKFLNDLAITLDRFARGKQRTALKVEKHYTSDGRSQTVLSMLPESVYEHLMFPGWTGEVWIEPGKEATQGEKFLKGYMSEKGDLCAVFGAGNQPCVAALDVINKVFCDSCVVVCKMNPVNEYAGPLLEEMFRPLIQAGVICFVYGGSETGQLLTASPQVDSIMITGSNQTHDAIVWQGKPKVGTPPMAKPVDSELGCVSPVVVVPGNWTDKELDDKAQDVVSGVVNNASFNCLAVKCVVVARGWALRDKFLARIEHHLQACSVRSCYYPGSRKKYDEFVNHYPEAKLLGAEGSQIVGGQIVHWALAREVAAVDGEYSLVNEPWCGVLSEVVVECGDDPVAFMEMAAHVANVQMWGTLSCGVLCDPRTQRRHAAALDRLLADLQYGAVVLNSMGLLGFIFAPLTWGGFAGRSTLADVQSGQGIVHNSFMIDNVQKSVLKVPWNTLPLTPYWSHRHRNAPAMGRRMIDFASNSSFLNFGKMVYAALRG